MDEQSGEMEMATAVAVGTKKSVARPLSVLIPLIKKDLEEGQEASEQAGLPYYQAAGEKMIEAKAQMKQGEFGPWAKRNFGISADQSQRYMALARTTSDMEKPRARELGSEIDRQAIKQKLDRMRQRKELNGQQYDRALILLRGM